MFPTQRLMAGCAFLASGILVAGCMGIIGGGPGSSPTSGGDGGVVTGPDGAVISPDGSTGPQPLACNAPMYPASTQMRRITFQQYQNAIRDIFNGSVTASGNFPGGTTNTTTGYSTEAQMYYPSLQSVQSIMTAAEDVGQTVAGVIASLLPCSTGSNPGDACATTFIQQYGRRAFRHTPTSAETAALLATFDASVSAGASFGDAMGLLTDQMLQMPQFLYLADAAAPTTRPLTGLELATRLSFMLWDSIPDDTLLNAAENNGLTDRASVMAQASRLLASPNAAPTLARFIREWTGSSPIAQPWSTGEVSTADKDPGTFPFLNTAYVQSINSSFDRFVAAELQGSGTVNDLLRSPDVYVDATMASFYGVTPPAAGMWTRVSLDPTKYSGIMTQPAMLGALAHTSVSSPVYRGVFTLLRLLCQPLGSPPANAQAIAMQQASTLPPNPTARQVSALRQSTAPCSGCHSIIDPAGLAFEHFDALGQYRQTYTGGTAIDTTGTFVGVPGQTITFTDQVDLLQQLSQVDAVDDCMSRQVFRFTMSQMEASTDACTIQNLDNELSSTSGKVGDLLVTMTGSDAFLYRSDMP